MTDRKATAKWTGDLASGSGRVSLDSSGVGEFDVSWPARTEEPNGVTSPEELIAAAHSSCYCMQFSALLARAGTPPERIETSAKVSFGRSGGGYAITGIVLTVRATVPGIEADKFAEIAEQAKQTCPVSAALTGTTIELDAALA
ncbi:Organic hydroperoxide resistance protein [Alloactinosynnema sp. L-07]|uniref:OsmC family protein n=1 Tax=Alloactinosynnema sp. L-07 TaxID=1653480 RepID=UPI00065F07CA|nr:OsmC family protein [Alloactinosynnema sp. L-07]CRK55994.1 Organic hydroperoxide resistance protein [Alloactinosynnema sp. L-07]